MLAHSLRLVFPRITAPAARNLIATNESLGGFEPTKASDPAVVIMRSAVSILSLIRIGIPCNRLRGPLALNSRSRSSAIAMASGFFSITAFTAGPVLSISSMRAPYFSTRDLAVNLPDFIPSCNSEIVISSNSKGLMSGALLLAGAITRAPPSAGYKSAALVAERD